MSKHVSTTTIDVDPLTSARDGLYLCVKKTTKTKTRRLTVTSLQSIRGGLDVQSRTTTTRASGGDDDDPNGSIIIIGRDGP